MGFSSSLRNVPKIKNHAASKSAKVTIRQNVLAEIPRPARVFDAFAGTGEMHRAVWHDADAYTGCDLEWARDGRMAYVADNRRVMRSADLQKFNIFDLDAFGSPWEQAAILAKRRVTGEGEAVGVILTDGSCLALKQGGIPGAMAMFAGLSGNLSGLARWQDDVEDRAISGFARAMKCKILRRWQAKGKTGAGVRYIGLVLAGINDAEEPGAGCSIPSGDISEGHA